MTGRLTCYRLNSAAAGRPLHAWHRAIDLDDERTVCGIVLTLTERWDSYSGPTDASGPEGLRCPLCFPQRARGLRRFFLDRQTDVSGTSGTGAVVEGVQFADGTCVVHWLTSLSSIGVYASIEDVVAIHGHNGATNLHWVDEVGWAPAP